MPMQARSPIDLGAARVIAALHGVVFAVACMH